MAKGEITVTIKVPYEISPASYPPEADTDEKRLAMDLKNAEEGDSYLFIDQQDAQWSFEGRIVPEDGQ